MSKKSEVMKNKNILSPSLKLLSPTPLMTPNVTNEDKVDWSDYIIGTLYIVIGVLFAIFIVWIYWILHGGDINTFAFWSSDDKKWIEVLFWSLFTVHAWNITDAANWMWYKGFQKRFVWYYIGRMFETPPISLALVFVIINLGVAFGDTTISLKESPILIIIALAIISAYFSQQTIDSLKEVAIWITGQVKSKLNPEE